MHDDWKVELSIITTYSVNFLWLTILLNLINLEIFFHFFQFQVLYIYTHDIYIHADTGLSPVKFNLW